LSRILKVRRRHRRIYQRNSKRRIKDLCVCLRLYCEFCGSFLRADVYIHRLYMGIFCTLHAVCFPARSVVFFLFPSRRRLSLHLQYWLEQTLLLLETFLFMSLRYIHTIVWWMILFVYTFIPISKIDDDVFTRVSFLGVFFAVQLMKRRLLPLHRVCHCRLL
jgi:hypothetical protein